MFSHLGEWNFSQFFLKEKVVNQNLKIVIVLALVLMFVEGMSLGFIITGEIRENVELKQQLEQTTSQLADERTQNVALKKQVDRLLRGLGSSQEISSLGPQDPFDTSK